MGTRGSTRSHSNGSSSTRDTGTRQSIVFASTALILLVLYGWTFVVHPQHLAPRTDPAYYSWRIQALISEKPSTLLHITGPFNEFSGGYRIAGTILGSYLRRIAGVSELKTTVVLIVTQWAVTALLLAGFAYRQRRDPLIFTAVALGSGSLLITPPFVGYADNVLCLLFLAAALSFITPAAFSWRARLGLGLFLLIAGFTHPTTLIIFCITLGVMAVVRFCLTRFDLRTTRRLDGWVLGTAAISLLVTFLSWTIGIWGVPESLSEAALPPPKSRAAFIQKLILWVKAMQPSWNGPLLAIGVLGLLFAWKRGTQKDLSRISIVWLAPLVGLFGFLFGLTYPYFRFLNSTLAWVLLVGIGTYLVIRFCIDISRRGGVARLALVGVAVVAAVITSNFALKLSAPKWNNAHGGWLTVTEKRDLDSVRSSLAKLHTANRPVVFVVDLRARHPWKIYGFAKTSSNRSRYGLPLGQIDNGYEYLGSLTKLISGLPTRTGNATYDRLSRGYLAEAERGIESSGKRPIIVVEKMLNVPGRNARFFRGSPRSPSATSGDVWFVANGKVRSADGRVIASHPPVSPASPPWHLARVVGGLLLLLLPGLIGVRRLIPDLSLGEALGMVPALSMALLALGGIVVLAVARLPFSGAIPWISLVVSTGLALAIPAIPRRSGSIGPVAGTSGIPG